MYKLIIVEDDYQIRMGLSKFFPWEKLGFAMINSFDNGKKALEYLKTNRDINAILTDIKMPVLDGIELVKKVREMDMDVNVVFLTAYCDFHYAQKAIYYNVSKYIVKSSKYNELITVFTELKNNLDRKKTLKSSMNFSENSFNVYSGNISDQLIQKIMDFINKNIADVNLQSLANYVNLNPVYLSRYFKQKTDTNFINYVTEVKMSIAANMLCSSDKSVAFIGEQIGYTSEGNFSRAFKKHFGVSPIDYRKVKGGHA